MTKKRIFRVMKWFFGIILGLCMLITVILYVFKDEICNMAIRELNKSLKADVSVSKVDLTFWSTFPNLSIDFNNVFVQDVVEGATQMDTLLYTERVRCKLNPFDIWKEKYQIKKVEVSPGVLNLKVDSLGNNNYDILKEKNDSIQEEPMDMKLDVVEFENFRFNYSNEATSQVYQTKIHSLELNGSLSEKIFTSKAKSKMQIVSAKSGNVTLLSNKPAVLDLKLEVNTDSASVKIPRSTILIANLPFYFEGDVERSGFQFALSGKEIGIMDAANNFALKQSEDIKKFSGRGKLKFDVNIEGKNDAQSPVDIDCEFGIEKGTLRDPNSGITMSNLNLLGQYSNRGGQKKEYLNLEKIAFRTNGGPFKGKLMLTNFNAPVYRGDVNGLLNLAVVRSLFKLTSLKQLKGTVNLSSNFVIQQEVLEDESSLFHINKCEGTVRFNNVLAQLIDDKRVYKNINGSAYLKNENVGIDNVELKIGNSDFLLKGSFSDVVDYFTKKSELIADVSIKSKRINLADLGSDSKSDKLHHDRVFILPDDIRGKVYLDIGSLKYDKHTFHKLEGNMEINNRLLDFKKISVRSGGADIRASLSIKEYNPEMFEINTHLVSNNINFKSLFKEWDNFNQDVITSKNISGVAQANVKFKAPFDFRSGILSKSIVAQIGLQIDNGRLRNVESFREITKSLKATPSARLAIGKENINEFERKLLDLKFKQLKNTFVIAEGILSIPSMSIESSALDVELSGNHSFENQVDYRFGFRFRDLKKKQQSEFGEIVDDGSGKHVFMRMYGNLDNPSIEWDKENNKEYKQEKREEAISDAKSIFKSEFGMFSKDTTIQKYVDHKRPHEELIIETNPVDSIDDIMDAKKPIKNTKVSRFIEKMKQDAKKEEEEFEIEF